MIDRNIARDNVLEPSSTVQCMGSGRVRQMYRDQQGIQYQEGAELGQPPSRTGGTHPSNIAIIDTMGRRRTPSEVDVDAQTAQRARAALENATMSMRKGQQGASGSGEWDGRRRSSTRTTPVPGGVVLPAIGSSDAANGAGGTASRRTASLAAAERAYDRHDPVIPTVPLSSVTTPAQRAAAVRKGRQRPRGASVSPKQRTFLVDTTGPARVYTGEMDGGGAKSGSVTARAVLQSGRTSTHGDRGAPRLSYSSTALRTRGGEIPPTLIPEEDHIIEKSPVPVTGEGSLENTRFDPMTKMWHRTVFPVLRPSGRNDVVMLEQWLETKVATLADSKLSLVQMTREVQELYNIAFRELVRQVSVQCIERGQLMLKLWRRYVQLFHRTVDLVQQDKTSCVNEVVRETARKIEVVRSKHDTNTTRMKMDYSAELRTLLERDRVSMEQIDVLKNQLAAATTEVSELQEKLASQDQVENTSNKRLKSLQEKYFELLDINRSLRAKLDKPQSVASVAVGIEHEDRVHLGLCIDVSTGLERKMTDIFEPIARRGINASLSESMPHLGSQEGDSDYVEEDVMEYNDMCMRHGREGLTMVVNAAARSVQRLEDIEHTDVMEELGYSEEDLLIMEAGRNERKHAAFMGCLRACLLCNRSVVARLVVEESSVASKKNARMDASQSALARRKNVEDDEALSAVVDAVFKRQADGKAASCDACCQTALAFSTDFDVMDMVSDGMDAPKVTSSNATVPKKDKHGPISKKQRSGQSSSKKTGSFAYDFDEAFVFEVASIMVDQTGTIGDGAVDERFGRGKLINQDDSDTVQAVRSGKLTSLPDRRVGDTGLADMVKGFKRDAKLSATGNVQLSIRLRKSFETYANGVEIETENDVDRFLATVSSTVAVLKTSQQAARARVHELEGVLRDQTAASLTLSAIINDRTKVGLFAAAPPPSIAVEGDEILGGDDSSQQSNALSNSRGSFAGVTLTGSAEDDTARVLTGDAMELGSPLELSQNGLPKFQISSETGADRDVPIALSRSASKRRRGKKKGEGSQRSLRDSKVQIVDTAVQVGDERFWYDIAYVVKRDESGTIWYQDRQTGRRFVVTESEHVRMTCSELSSRVMTKGVCSETPNGNAFHLYLPFSVKASVSNKSAAFFLRASYAQEVVGQATALAVSRNARNGGCLRRRSASSVSVSGGRGGGGTVSPYTIASPTVIDSPVAFGRAQPPRGTPPPANWTRDRLPRVGSISGLSAPATPLSGNTAGSGINSPTMGSTAIRERQKRRATMVLESFRDRDKSLADLESTTGSRRDDPADGYAVLDSQWLNKCGIPPGDSLELLAHAGRCWKPWDWMTTCDTAFMIGTYKEKHGQDDVLDIDLALNASAHLLRTVIAHQRVVWTLLREKMSNDSANDRINAVRKGMSSFLYDVYLHRYGLRSMAERHMTGLLQTVMELSRVDAWSCIVCRVLNMCEESHAIPAAGLDFFLHISNMFEECTHVAILDTIDDPGLASRDRLHRLGSAVLDWVMPMGPGIAHRAASIIGIALRCSFPLLLGRNGARPGVNDLERDFYSNLYGADEQGRLMLTEPNVALTVGEVLCNLMELWRMLSCSLGNLWKMRLCAAVCDTYRPGDTVTSCDAQYTPVPKGTLAPCVWDRCDLDAPCIDREILEQVVVNEYDPPSLGVDVGSAVIRNYGLLVRGDVNIPAKVGDEIQYLLDAAIEVERTVTVQPGDTSKAVPSYASVNSVLKAADNLGLLYFQIVERRGIERQRSRSRVQGPTSQAGDRSPGGSRSTSALGLGTPHRRSKSSFAGRARSRTRYN